jgi:signal transduction histidine kinase
MIFTAAHRNVPVAVTVDLGRVRPVEALALVPANVVFGSGDGRGYGFPVAFHVEASDDEGFEGAREVARMTRDRDAAPPPVVVLNLDKVDARFLRVTVTERWTHEGRNPAIVALGELLVFSRGRNVAPGKTVTATETIEGKPHWSVNYLVDGQSTLGHPVAPERSATNGYHSEIETVPDALKWVQLDLGSRLPLQEVRIIPARPIDWAASHGFGFPERFSVAASDDPDFRAPVTLLDHTAVLFPNPGDNPVVIPIDDLTARFVRFTSTRLWPRERDYVFALAEMEVISGGENVAARAIVSSHDSITQGLWKEDYLVDGFDSRSRLEPDELRWLRGIARRHELTFEANRVREKLRAGIGAVTSRLIWLASATGVALLALVGLTILRSRALRRRETHRLRERIASDLHDEIGSNLGSIALLSEIGADHGPLREIHRVARETVDSMHDIAWVIRSGHDTLDDLVIRMREVTGAMLRHLESSFGTVPATLPKRRISLRLKRNALLFFKEALHNIVRHSGARSASIRIEVQRDRLTLEISDDGAGFNPDAPGSQTGAGLKNMANRAATLGGSMRIHSAPGAGTTIHLVVPTG